jgi:hypothetical protein
MCCFSAASHEIRNSSETRLNFFARVLSECSNAYFLHLETQIRLNLNLIGVSTIATHYRDIPIIVKRNIYYMPTYLTKDSLYSSLKLMIVGP